MRTEGRIGVPAGKIRNPARRIQNPAVGFLDFSPVSARRSTARSPVVRSVMLGTGSQRASGIGGDEVADARALQEGGEQLIEFELRESQRRMGEQ